MQSSQQIISANNNIRGGLVFDSNFKSDLLKLNLDPNFLVAFERIVNTLCNIVKDSEFITDELIAQSAKQFDEVGSQPTNTSIHKVVHTDEQQLSGYGYFFDIGYASFLEQTMQFLPIPSLQWGHLARSVFSLFGFRCYRQQTFIWRWFVFHLTMKSLNHDDNIDFRRYSFNLFYSCTLKSNFEVDDLFQDQDIAKVQINLDDLFQMCLRCIQGKIELKYNPDYALQLLHFGDPEFINTRFLDIGITNIQKSVAVQAYHGSEVTNFDSEQYIKQNDKLKEFEELQNRNIQTIKQHFEEQKVESVANSELQQQKIVGVQNDNLMLKEDFSLIANYIDNIEKQSSVNTNQILSVVSKQQNDIEEMRVMMNNLSNQMSQIGITSDTKIQQIQNHVSSFSQNFSQKVETIKVTQNNLTLEVKRQETNLRNNLQQVGQKTTQVWNRKRKHSSNSEDSSDSIGSRSFYIFAKRVKDDAESEREKALERVRLQRALLEEQQGNIVPNQTGKIQPE